MAEPLFVIDLATCTGCQTCRIAYHDRAGTPDAVDLLSIKAEESGKLPSPHPHLSGDTLLPL